MDLRLVKQEELQQAVKLSDDTFRDQEHTSMGTAFPPIFDPGIIHSYGAFDGDRLVAFMGLVPAVIRAGEAKLRVFSMGSVCTHPDYRGQGIAGQLLELCKKHVESAGASLLFISGSRSLYTRSDCYLFGCTRHFSIGPDEAQRLAQSGSSRVREMEPCDLPAMHEIAGARPVAFEQSVTDLQQLIRSEAYAGIFKMKHRVLVSAAEDGTAQAYVIVAAPPEGKTMDRKPFAIEWGGPPDLVSALMGEAVLRLQLKGLNMVVPWQERELIGLLSQTGLEGTDKPNTGTVYLVSRQQLLRQAQPYFAAAGSSAEAERVVRELAPGELVSLLFDPDSPQASLLPGFSAIPLPFLSGLNYI